MIRWSGAGRSNALAGRVSSGKSLPMVVPGILSSLSFSLSLDPHIPTHSVFPEKKEKKKEIFA